MSFTVEWAWPARWVLLERLPWPASSDVAMGVHRFARDHAPRLPSGERRFLVAGYRITVHVNRDTRTVLVLYLYRRW